MSSTVGYMLEVSMRTGRHHLLAMLAVAGCAKGQPLEPDGGNGSGNRDAACTGTMCMDEDGDGVIDGMDQCPGTPAGQMVNRVGCSDSQLTPNLQPLFPPYGLGWTSGGNLGRPGGLTWTYTNIDRKDLFHIYWVICDDPALPCGLSLDGPIDQSESWQFSGASSDLAGGKVVFTNTTRINLMDGSQPTLTGRLTVTIVSSADVPFPFASLVTLNVSGRTGQYGADVPGTGFKVVALVEVQDPMTLAWTPYLDYYDAAPTPVAGGDAYISFGGSFYDE